MFRLAILSCLVWSRLFVCSFLLLLWRGTEGMRGEERRGDVRGTVRSKAGVEDEGVQTV